MEKQKKSNNRTPWFKFLLICAVLAGITGLGTLIILRSSASCSNIFEQTAPKLQANLKAIKISGTLVIGQEQIQVLSESSQKIGLHLKTCCSVLEGGKLDPDQFQTCIDKATAYDKKIASIAQQITEAVEAKEKGANNELQNKIKEIKQEIRETTSDAEKIDAQTKQIIALQSEPAEEKPSRSTNRDELPSVKGGYASIKLVVSEYGGEGIRYDILVNKVPLGIYESNKTIVLDRFLKPGSHNIVSWKFERENYGPHLSFEVKYSY